MRAPQTAEKATMLTHLFIGITDFDRALAFYGAVLSGLGLEARFCDRSRPWAGWQGRGEARPLLLIGRPFDGKPHDPGNGQMAALLADSRSLVDRMHAIALAHGGRCDGPPRLRPEYHENDHGRIGAALVFLHRERQHFRRLAERPRQRVGAGLRHRAAPLPRQHVRPAHATDANVLPYPALKRDVPRL